MEQWIYLSLIVCIVTGFEVTNLKFITKNCKKHNIRLIVSMGFVLLGFVSLLYLIYRREDVKKVKFSRNVILGLLFFGVLLLSNKYFFLNAVDVSPNVGYAHLIVNMNVILTLLLAYFLFGQTINKFTFFGISLCLIGLYVIIKTC